MRFALYLQSARCMNTTLVSLLALAAFVHHADPLGVYQPHRVGMILECSTYELLTRAAFMHHGDKRHNALRGLELILSLH